MACISFTCQGNSPTSAGTPPTILLSISALLGIPQSMNQVCVNDQCTTVIFLQQLPAAFSTLGDICSVVVTEVPGQVALVQYSHS